MTGPDGGRRKKFQGSSSVRAVSVRVRERHFELCAELLQPLNDRKGPVGTKDVGRCLIRATGAPHRQLRQVCPCVALGFILSNSVSLLAVATAVPPDVINQRGAARVAHETFSARIDDFEQLVKVFESSGIVRRHLVRPVNWYLEPLGRAERNAA